MAIVGDLGEGFELDARELALLAQACTAADQVAALEAVVVLEGATTVGSRGQTVIHPAVQEARQQKTLVLRLLQALDLQGDEADDSPAVRRARRAAGARVDRQARNTVRREGKRVSEG